MTIWILALLLLGGLAALGYQQGAIRAAISFIGIIVAALLAGPLSKLVKPAVAGLGVENPVLLWLIPPFVAFVIILSLFKVAGFSVHRKVDVYYRHTAGDLRLALWERLNSRLGLGLGLMNGLAYFVLICMVIHAFSYWTVQIASSDSDARIVKFFNQMGRDLQRTRMARVARAVDPMPEVYYDAADLAGLLYQNSLLEARLARYPAFLSLSERPEFRVIAQDTAFTEARLRRAPIGDVLNNPNMQAIVKSPDLLKLIWNTVSPDLKDLRAFLETGQSQKYSEPILGRWYFDVKGAVAAYVRSKANVPSSEMLKIRKWMTTAYAKTMLIASTDQQVVLKHMPQLRPAPGQATGTETQDLQGHWQSANGDYELTLESLGARKARVEAGRLIISGEGLPLVFTPED